MPGTKVGARGSRSMPLLVPMLKPELSQTSKCGLSWKRFWLGYLWVQKSYMFSMWNKMVLGFTKNIPIKSYLLENNFNKF